MYGNAPEIQLFLTVNFKLKCLGLVVNVGGLYKNIFLSLQMVRHILLPNEICISGTILLFIRTTRSCWDSGLLIFYEVLSSVTNT